MLNADKRAIIASVQKHENELIELSDKIWGYAEIAMREKQSSKALADYAEAQGLKVTRGVAKIPTAFIAEYGSGRPIIGILGEFDALPGLSQKAQPTKLLGSYYFCYCRFRFVLGRTGPPPPNKLCVPVQHSATRCVGRARTACLEVAANFEEIKPRNDMGSENDNNRFGIGRVLGLVFSSC